MPLSLARICVYPVKSARGFSPGAWPLDRLGLAYDRRWALALPDGRALTQREEPRLALLAPDLAGDHLALSAPGLTPLQLPLDGRPDAEPFRVRIHDVTLAGALVSARADAWLARFLGYPVRLVRVHEARVIDGRFAISDADRTGFADAFPLLVIGQASLDDLNARLAEPLPMDRFRPNLVVVGGAPYAEDSWRRVRVGGLEVALVKPCARCVITTTDQQTGARGVEPLRTLAGYRRGGGGKVLFGQNAIHLATGTLRTGDVVSVTDPGPGTTPDPARSPAPET